MKNVLFLLTLMLLVSCIDRTKNTNEQKETNEFEAAQEMMKQNVPQDENTALVNGQPVYTVVEEMPSYPGGDDARIKFLVANIRYPQMAKESGIQGTVFVTFVVDDKGKICNVKCLRGIGGGCDEEAVRVVKLMPKWTPGKQAGKNVNVQFNMPVRYTLD